MGNLLEKVHNCYINLLDNIQFGRTSIPYCLIRDALYYLKYDFDNERYYQYFYNHLRCPIKYPLDIIEGATNNVISWTINAASTVDNTFSWTEIDAPSSNTYEVITNSVSGFNFFYVGIPQGMNCLIYNELNLLMFDSTQADSTSQLFEAAGTITTTENQTNVVYKKKDIYNTLNSVKFKIKIY